MLVMMMVTLMMVVKANLTLSGFGLESPRDATAGYQDPPRPARPCLHPGNQLKIPPKYIATLKKLKVDKCIDI